MAFNKPVTSMERVYLAYNSFRPPFANQLVVSGSGKLDADQLAHALAIAGKVNPGSALCLRGNLKSLRWVDAAPAKLSLIENTSWSGINNDNAGFLQAPLYANTGPSCELQYLQQGEKFYLIFRSLHAVMDGMGTWLWANDVLRILAGEKPVGHASALTDCDIARQLTDKVMELPPVNAQHPCGKADAITSGNHYHWQLLQLEKVYEPVLLARIALSIARQVRSHVADVAVRFNIPCDLRSFCKAKTTGNMIGTLFVDVAEEMNADGLSLQLIQKIYKKHHARLPEHYDILQWIPLWLIKMALSSAYKKEHQSGFYPFSATLSNLGKLELLPLQCAQIDNVFFIPPYADQHCFVMLNGFADRSNIVVAVSEAFVSDNRFVNLQQQLLQDIDAI